MRQHRGELGPLAALLALVEPTRRGPRARHRRLACMISTVCTVTRSWPRCHRRRRRAGAGTSPPLPPHPQRGERGPQGPALNSGRLVVGSLAVAASGIFVLAVVAFTWVGQRPDIAVLG